MMKLLGKGNDLYTESGRITKSGYMVLVVSTIFGLACFLTGREIYGRILKKRLIKQFEKGVEIVVKRDNYSVQL